MKIDLEQLKEMQEDLFKQQCDLDIQKAMVKHFINKREAAISVTRCSLQLKDKKTITFDEFAKENNYTQNFLYIYRDGKTFKPSEIMKRYKTYLLSL